MKYGTILFVELLRYGVNYTMNLRNLSQEELIKKINMLEERIKRQDNEINVLSEQLNWYSQQIRLQQKKLFGSSSEKTVLPDQISLFDEIEIESTCTTCDTTSFGKKAIRNKKLSNALTLKLSIIDW